MRLLILLSLLSLLLGPAWADECSDANCKLPSCSCSGTNIPGNLSAADVPQMVMLTFDDAITKLNFNNYYVKTIFNRKNPDGCQISVTYFATHEYNDYNLTHRLYREGHEIALHSISHQPGLDYWGEASVEDLEREFIDQRDILIKFGLIPIEAMKGTRSPYLKLAGDNTFKMMQKNNILWDCSMPTLQFTEPAMWPYTLDFPTKQDCPIPPCPTSTFPGLWEVPMVDWINDDGIPCPMVDTCPVINDADDLYDFIIKNFERHYKGNRAPFPFFMHAAWFAIIDPMRMEVYNRFLDYLSTLDDVYIVSISRMLEWVQKPTPLANMKTFWQCWTPPENKCVPRNCELVREDNGQLRYMMQCGDCPKVYPWLGNPNGDKKN